MAKSNTVKIKANKRLGHLDIGEHDVHCSRTGIPSLPHIRKALKNGDAELVKAAAKTPKKVSEDK